MDDFLVIDIFQWVAMMAIFACQQLTHAIYSKRLKALWALLIEIQTKYNDAMERHDAL